MKKLRFILALLFALPAFGQTTRFTNINVSSDTKSLTFTSQAANPADSGVIRLGNGELIAWESSPAGTDVTFGVDSSEVFQFSSSINVTGSVTMTGGMTTGVGGSTAGVLELGQGTAPSDGTTSVKIYAPASVTSYKRVLPAAVGSTGYTKQTVSGTTQTESIVPIVESIGFGSDAGAGTPVTTGAFRTARQVPYAGTITAITIMVDTGTATVEFWKIAAGTALPTDANSINTSGVSISSGTVVRITSLGDLTTTAVAANDIIMCEATALSGPTWIAVQMEITR